MTLGDQILHGYAEADPFAGLMVSQVNGWRGLPGSRANGDMIPGGQGSYALTGILREPRSIEVVGAAIAASEAEALQLLRQLEAELGVEPVEMRVLDDSGEWSRTVETEAVSIIGQFNRGQIRFSIDLIAPDPRRYQTWLVSGPAGLPVRTGGLILPSAFPWHFGTYEFPVATIENVGDVEILPRISLRGSASGVVVIGGPQRLEYGSFSGELLFDADDRRAWLNGADVTQYMIRRDWPVVGPGEISNFYFEAISPSPDLSLMVQYRIGAW